MSVRLENTFFEELAGLYLSAPPSGFERPKLLLFNDRLAEALGVSELREHAVDLFSGNRALEGSTPIALAYAGHQFGSFSPQLGDGRAVLLGELATGSGKLVDLQLKGSGPTQFSRGGDGKATLGPVLREYLISEAMFHLGVPTTRVLCALETGEKVARERLLPGAVLCRVASSHLRIGSLEFLAVRRKTETLEKVVRYALKRHYPERMGKQNPALALLEAVALAQAELIAQWMLVGFVHGVMNTDNMALSGETIDYGPCAFMDNYDERTVFSSIDHGGRYAYGNQPLIGKWNLARMGEALLRLISDSKEDAIASVQSILDVYEAHYQTSYLVGMRAKLGFRGEHESDAELCRDILQLLQDSNADFTTWFRELSHDLRELGTPQWGPMGQELGERYLARLEGEDRQAVATRMERINPLYIPRNHRVEEVLAAAHEGDLDKFREFLRILEQPFSPQAGAEKYLEPPPADFGPYRTFCGT